jgi:hypothetical protein
MDMRRVIQKMRRNRRNYTGKILDMKMKFMKNTILYIEEDEVPVYIPQLLMQGIPSASRWKYSCPHGLPF